MSNLDTDIPISACGRPNVDLTDQCEDCGRVFDFVAGPLTGHRALGTGNSDFSQGGRERNSAGADPHSPAASVPGAGAPVGSHGGGSRPPGISDCGTGFQPVDILCERIVADLVTLNDSIRAYHDRLALLPLSGYAARMTVLIAQINAIPVTARIDIIKRGNVRNDPPPLVNLGPGGAFTRDTLAVH